jgi:hypothetical protein
VNRYFKATDGQFTVFRMSPTRVYAAAWLQIVKGCPIFGFSAKLSPKAPLPVEEIVKSEYEALVARKIRRVEARKSELIASGAKVWGDYGSSPSDSWVVN